MQGGLMPAKIKAPLGLPWGALIFTAIFRVGSAPR